MFVGLASRFFSSILVATFLLSCGEGHSEVSAPTGSSAARPAGDASSAPAPSASTSAAASSAPPIHFVVTEDPVHDSWDVRWEFTTPTPGIIFDRRDPLFRHESWTPGPGLQWVIEGGHELLKPVDGAPRTTFSAHFATDDASRDRSPPLDVKFSDGSRLLFTADLGVHAIECPNGHCDRRGLGDARVWEFHTAPHRTLRVLEDAHDGELVWHEPPGDLRGTYVYAGSIEPEDASGAKLVVDPGLPGWLRTKTETVLPKVLSMYRDKTGLELDFHPLIVMSRSMTDPGKLALRGRTLPHLMQLEAIGDGWNAESERGDALWFEFVAHESFHFYNSQLARRTGDPKDEWLSEGSATYVAGLALRETGVLDEPGAKRRLVRSANECIATLHSGLWDEKAEPSYYACGELVMFAVDHDLTDSGGLFGLMKALFARARERGTYSAQDWLDLLHERTKHPAFEAEVKQVLTSGLGDQPEVFVAKLLEGGGIATTRVAATKKDPAHLELKKP